MRKIFITILIISMLLLLGGCSKDEEVAKLEQETIEAESGDMQTETEADAGETYEEPDTAASEYALTPETTPEEEPEPEVTSDYSGMGGYTIQIGSGTDYENAQYLMRKFIDRGYDAFMTEAYINDELVYRIRIGNYDSFAEAEAMALKLKDKFSVKFWIDMNE